jgi:hypothetical protein
MQFGATINSFLSQPSCRFFAWIAPSLYRLPTWWGIAPASFCGTSANFYLELIPDLPGADN